MRKVFLILIAVMACFFVTTVIHAQSEIQNMDIIDADIRDVLRSFGELGGYNVLMDKTVQGSISLKFSSALSVKDAIQMVSQTYGYSFIWANSATVIIGNKDTFKDFGVMTTKVYSLQFATVDQTIEALKVVIPVERIGKDVRSNALAIKANALEHENIAEVIKRLDREVPQVNIDLRVEELSTADTTALGFSPEITGGYNSVSHWYITPTTTLNALETTKKTKLLANPNISTTDNQEGQILIGEKYPIITKTVDQTTKMATYTANYIEIGTKLSITPRINSDDVVTVTVKAEISNINGSVKIDDTATGGGISEFPIIDTRQTNSVVRLKHGETFVLSGLSSMQKTEETKSTPFLSKVPVIGWLFKNKNTTPNSTEVCIFLTPHIVRTQKADDAPKSNVKDDSITKTDTAIAQDNLTPATTNTSTVTATAATTQSTDSQSTTQVQPAATTNTKTDTTTTASTTDTKSKDDNSTVTAVDTKTKDDTATATPTDTSVKSEDAPAPPPEPIQVVIDDKTNTTTATTTTTNTTSATATNTTVSNTTVMTDSIKEVQYTVKKEDNLFQISKKYGVNLDLIVKRNGLNAKDSIKIGQSIVIPIPSDHLYQIKPKETLWRIAKRYGTTVDVLTEINGLSDSTQVKSGQTIILPTVSDKVVNAEY